MKLFHLSAALLLSGLACSCTTPTPVVTPPTPAQILSDASGEDFACTRATASTVSFEKFAAAPKAYADKCVIVKGLASAHFLFRDANAIPAQKAAHMPFSPIGLYWKDETEMKKLEAGPQFVELVGRVRACDARNTLLHEAGVSETGACTSALVAIFISQDHVFPTAMD